ncbi:MAG: glycosyltransferase [Verrucomicrobia bacterium]|nr:glycosyltransferase [Verrucomicrobiota bacterium]
MHTNSIEAWLARMHRHAVKSDIPVDWHYHVQSIEPGALEERYQELSGRVIRSRRSLSPPWAFFRDFHEVCRMGNYDVVHVHADLMSALYLVAARLAGHAKLIAHVHNADETVPVGSAWKKSLLREPMRRTCLVLADKIVGVSNHTLDTFLQGRPRRPGRDVVQYLGIDPKPFLKASADQVQFRRELGLPQDSLVLLFANRFVPEKNPIFALEVLGELRKLEPRAVGVFVGSGGEEQALRTRVSALGLKEGTRFLGWRIDVPDIMCCCDWFILPHLEKPMEGFGLAVVEAQLAGLRLLLSRGIADDPLLPGCCVRRLSLAEPASLWASEAYSQLNEFAPNRDEAAKALANSPMDMDRALANLIQIYQG